MESVGTDHNKAAEQAARLPASLACPGRVGSWCSGATGLVQSETRCNGRCVWWAVSGRLAENGAGQVTAGVMHSGRGGRGRAGRSGRGGGDEAAWREEVHWRSQSVWRWQERERKSGLGLEKKREESFEGAG